MSNHTPQVNLVSIQSPPPPLPKTLKNITKKSNQNTPKTAKMTKKHTFF